MTAGPTVSVILATYQRARLLPRAMESVLTQTFDDFELIVVDDASTDDTPRVVADVADRRVRFVRLERNRGPAGARNEGIRRAVAPLLAFQDSDDEWLPEKLARQMALLAGREADTAAVYCDMERVQEDGSVQPHRSPDVVRGRLVDPGRGVYQVYGLGIQSTLIRRACLDRVGLFDERYRCFDDLELFLRLAADFEFAHLPEPLVRYHASVGVSADRPAELRARTLLLRTHFGRLARTQPAFLLREAARVGVGRMGVAVRRWVGGSP